MRYILLSLLALCLVQSIRCEGFKEEFEEGSGAIVDEIPTDDDDSIFSEAAEEIEEIEEELEEEYGSGSGDDNNKEIQYDDELNLVVNKTSLLTTTTTSQPLLTSTGDDMGTDDTEEPRTVKPMPGKPVVNGLDIGVGDSDETDLEENSPDDVAPLGTASFLSQTHFIVALVVGGCVGLLFAICAIMLLAYRMRKKDEGSYALDEQKKPSSGYQYTAGRGPQEYYA